jgi:hypothetical protein
MSLAGSGERRHDVQAMYDAQRARLATLRDGYHNVAWTSTASTGGDNLLHVVVYGRLTGAEVAVHTIALDGHLVS